MLLMWAMIRLSDYCMMRIRSDGSMGNKLPILPLINRK